MNKNRMVMNFRHYTLSIVLFLLSLELCSAQQKLNDSIVQALRIGVEGFKERYSSPSIVVVIVHGDEIIFSEALGHTDIEGKVPATIGSKYPIQSITKMFTATILMQLVEHGQVDLDDDIGEYVPEYTGDDTGTTLMQLATHASGLPRNSPVDIHFAEQVDSWLLADREYKAIASATKEEFLGSLKFIQKEYPEYQLLSCGDRHYSNLGYSLLGTGLERAVGMDFGQYVVSRICMPLKMEHTGFGIEDMENKLAKGYHFKEDIKEFVEVPIYRPNSIIYAGGMYSTATDLARFISFQFDDDRDTRSGILSLKNRRMMQYLGIGWKRSYPFVYHEGSMLGFRSEIVIDPGTKIGWAILTNTTDFEFGKINDYIAGLVRPFYQKEAIVDLEKYVGTYSLEGGYGSLKIYLKEGELHSTYLQGSFPEQPLVPTGGHRFKGQGNADYSIGYEFMANADSEITALNLGQLMWVKQ